MRHTDIPIGPAKYTVAGTLTIASYHDGSVCLIIDDPETGEHQAKATVNMADFPVTQDLYQVWIKTWSENEGILEALEKAGLVEQTGVSFDVNGHGSMAVLVNMTGPLYGEWAAQTEDMLNDFAEAAS